MSDSDVSKMESIMSQPELVPYDYFIDGQCYGFYGDKINGFIDAEYISEQCAEDYFDNHDGWESRWPLDLELFYEGKSLGAFRIEREDRPHFSATSLINRA